jgi:surface protein
MRLLTRDGRLLIRGGKLIGRSSPIPDAETDFIMLVKTDNTGTSEDNQFIIPTFGSGYDYQVETSEQLLSNQTGNVTLEWGSAGTYEVRIRGTFPRIFFNGLGDRLKLLEVQNWGDIEWSSMGSAFQGCSNLELTATDVPDLSNVTNMDSMFANASSFNGDLSDWDVSNVTNMDFMFVNASSFNGDLSDWDVSNVTNMIGMFVNASSFNGDISDWDVSNVTNMIGMFQTASSFNQDISDWDVSNVTNMDSMFADASSFNQDLSGWCVGQIMFEPDEFAIGANAWILPKPNWGEPC